MSNRLAGKIALVTGGGTGIGLATAKEFAAQGATVFITGRRQAELDKAVAAIGPNAIGIQGDVSKQADLDRIQAEIASKAGRLDVLVANAGGGSFLPLGAITDEQYETIFGSNVKGLLFTVQTVLPLIPKGGSIVLIGSTTAVMGTEAFSVYSASKAAVRNFARSWTLDLKTRGIRVNTLSPGPIRTPGLEGVVPPDQLQGLVDQLAAAVPLGRIGDPSEVAKVALFLASDDSSFVNGIELFVDGGLAQV